MEPAALKEMRTETQGQFGGLGIRIAVRDNWLTVITPMPRHAGLPPRGPSRRQDHTNRYRVTQGMGVEDAVNLLRGKPGTKVTIHIAVKGTKSPGSSPSPGRSSKSRASPPALLEPTIGYVRLNEFIETSAADLSKSLKDLRAKGMRSLVLDLRNNPGGLLTSAVEVSKLFLGDGKLIVYTQGRAQPRQDFLADSRALFEDVPLAVLVNGGSASASEIVTGAVQDHRPRGDHRLRNLRQGERPVGHPPGRRLALRLTVAKYYTPAGRSIHRDEKTKAGGVTPDIVIAVSKEPRRSCTPRR
jgi:carboxyl-terminal processing protease